jgi:hypothetical protein
VSERQPIDLEDLQRVSVKVREMTDDNWLADMVELAAAEIARLREERRWVSVGERLPPNEEWVDVAGRWGDCLGWHDGEEWRNVEEDPFPSEVTHWRKRTPGPEGDGNG